MTRPSVPITSGKTEISPSLWGIYKIARLAKYAHFRDFVKRGTYKAPFTLIGARCKPGLSSSKKSRLFEYVHGQDAGILVEGLIPPGPCGIAEVAGGIPVCRRVSFVLVAWTSKVTVTSTSVGKSLLMP